MKTGLGPRKVILSLIPPHHYRIPERAELVQLLIYFSTPTTEEELYRRRLRYIRFLEQWQNRKEAPRRGRQAEATVVHLQQTSTSPNLSIVPGIYDPLQCPFCLSNPGLPPASCEKRKSKINKFWDHVEKLHQPELAAFDTGSKRCGLCGLRNNNYRPSSVSQFENHTETVHGIRLRA
jgi:hypothetical protein